jgi:hypothetical protein
MNILLKYGKKRRCNQIPKHITLSFPTGMASQREGLPRKRHQERWPKNKQNKRKLGDLLPYLSQLIQGLPRRRNKHE